MESYEAFVTKRIGSAATPNKSMEKDEMNQPL